MSDDFYPFVDSGDPAPDNAHLLGKRRETSTAASSPEGQDGAERVRYATRIAVYDDMLSTPRVLVVDPADVRTYLEEVTNTVYRCMKEQGGGISLMVIREIVENFIHAHFVEPIISVLDGGNTIRFADQGPGIDDKERAFEFGVTSADREQKRYIRGTGAGFPMVQQYLENAGGAVSIEDNMGQGTVVTVTVDPARAEEVSRSASRGAAVRGGARKGAATAAQPCAQAETAIAPQQPTQTVEPAGSRMSDQQGAPMMPAAIGQAAAAPQPVAAQEAAYPYAPYPAYPYPYQAPAQPTGQQAPAWQGYPPYYQPYQVPAGYPAPMPAPQPQPLAAPAPMGAYAPRQTPAPAAGPQVTQRGMQAMAYLAEHGVCGPTDLAAAFGSSNATWSRELEALANQGLVVKQGQKRVLTDMGRLWLSNGTPSAGTA